MYVYRFQEDLNSKKTEKEKGGRGGEFEQKQIIGLLHSFSTEKNCVIQFIKRFKKKQQNICNQCSGEVFGII